MNDWITFYDNEDIDLRTELNAFESALIKEGYLNDRTSKSYKALYRSLSEEVNPKIDLPDNVSLACVKINKQTESTLITRIKFFSELEELIGETEYDKSGWKDYPFLGVSDMITNETTNNETVKSYLLSNLMIIALDLSSDLKNNLPKSNLKTEGLEVVKLINTREIIFREKSYTIEEFENFLCNNDNIIANLSLVLKEDLATSEVIVFMRLCKTKKIKLTLSNEKIKN